MIDAAFNDPRIADHVSPEVLAFIQNNQPAEDTTKDFQIGHWIAVAIAALNVVNTQSEELSQARQQIHELEADR